MLSGEKIMQQLLTTVTQFCINYKTVINKSIYMLTSIKKIL